jgi:gas vesicle protein
MNKERIEQILNQAKQSVRALEDLQKSGMSHVHELLNKKNLVKTVKKLGLATKEDIRDLNDRIDDLASELRQQISQIKKASKEK